MIKLSNKEISSTNGASWFSAKPTFSCECNFMNYSYILMTDSIKKGKGKADEAACKDFNKQQTPGTICTFFSYEGKGNNAYNIKSIDCSPVNQDNNVIVNG